MTDTKFDGTFVAHISERTHRTQPLAAHLADVAALAKAHAEKLVLPRCAELIGLLHDLGKYSDEFQTYIKSAGGWLDQDADDEAVDTKGLKGKVDHSTAGAQWVWRELSTIEASR